LQQIAQQQPYKPDRIIAQHIWYRAELWTFTDKWDRKLYEVPALS
jgi:hypothetical protein